MKQRTLLLGSIGAGLEYYDFVIYALLIPYFSPCLFPQVHPGQAHIMAFVIFALGFLVRPLGGMVLGYASDRWGRKTSFYMVMMIMACATLGVALIPSAREIGYAAVFLLLILRLTQGVAFGGGITVWHCVYGGTCSTEATWSYVWGDDCQCGSGLCDCHWCVFWLKCLS